MRPTESAQRSLPDVKITPTATLASSVYDLSLIHI